ncbi:DUF2382 domain-containing protein [Deinococcus radiotolerans]|uniref:DUF2382 domain-containing protein n=1 Tax=Deinococcus radiotolerans TaxID=1309407 RepID=A0ABQ2FL17_9DEIO|nr:DUF2382 domain-containing protein [Deinococcus radiotolerans]GGL08615.1 hypothetical protein GCM10010844_29230 [Deinococcus radiotolerans]
MDNDTEVKRVPVGTLELREERATFAKQRVLAGQVIVRRERRTRVETVEVELTEEVLVIEVAAGHGQVLLDGVQLEPGTIREIQLTQEQVQVVKQVYAVQDVHLTRETRTVQHTVPVELAYEELAVDRRNVHGQLVVQPPPGEEES